jgi:hypothetical protein
MRKIFAIISLVICTIYVANSQIILSSDTTASCNNFSYNLQALSTNLSSISSDDTHSSVVDIGFSFNFYGTNYTQLLISGNGYLTFDLAQAGLSSPYIINSAIPNPGSIPENAIMAPWQDINPAVNGSITFGTVGTAPNRKFIVTWCAIPMFSCTSLLHTSQIVLYESSNKIEMFLANKPLCTTWNNGAAIQGLVSTNSTNFDIVNDPNIPGNPPRNYDLQWSASDEGWEFLPNGNTSYSINEIAYIPIIAGLVNWYDNSSLVTPIGSGPNLPISLNTTGIYTYYAQISGACSGGTLIDSVIINFDESCCSYAGDGNPNPIGICGTDLPFNLIDLLNNNPSTNGSWIDPDGNIISSGIFNPALSLNGTYTYNIAATETCPEDNAFLTFNVTDISNLTVLPDTVCSSSSPLTLTPNILGGLFSGPNITNPDIFLPNSIGINSITYTLPSGCGADLNIVVFETPTLLTQNVSQPPCPGDLTGSVEILSSGGSTPYQIDWFGENPLALTDGVYNYTVFDANQCSFNGSVTIIAPITPTLTSYNSSCFGDNNGSIEITLNAPSTPPGTISNLTYCDSGPNTNANYSASSSIIKDVALIGDNNDINNNTELLPDFYEDYTSTLYADITQGQTYTVKVTLDSIGNFTSANLSGAKVYIDFNIDGDFSDAGEELGVIPYRTLSTLGITDSISFTVPNTGFYGPTRMRVVSQYVPGSNPNSNSITPCAFAGSIQCPTCVPIHGATEDYSIVLNLPTANTSILWENNLTADSISGLGPDTYTVTITYDSLCAFIDSATILEPSEILFNEDIIDILCSSSSGEISLSPSGGFGGPYTFEWFNQNSGLLIGQTTAIASGLASGSYDVVITDPSTISTTNLSACSDTASFTLLEAPIFNVDFSNSDSDSTICLNEPLSLIFDFFQGGTAPFTINYNVTNNAGVTNAQVAGPFISSLNYLEINPSVGNNIYDITSIVDANGCINQNSINSQSIYVNPLPDINISVVPEEICIGNDYNLNISGSIGTAPFILEYFEETNLNTISVPSSGLSLLNSNTNNSTSYSLSYVTDANGCASPVSAQAVLTVNENPQLNFTTPNTDVCDGEIIQLQFNFSSGEAPWTVNYSENGLPSIFTLNNSSDSISIISSSTSIYTINNIIDNNNCRTDVNQTLTINSNPLPTINLSGGGSICGDGNTADVIFTISSGTPPYNLNYSNGLNSNFVSNIGNFLQISTDQGGFYTIQDLTDSENCKATTITGSAYVNINPTPEANITVYPQSTTIDNPLINFIDNSNGHINGTWNFDDGNSTQTNFSNLSHSYTDTGYFQVSLTIVSDSGCTDTAKQIIIITPSFNIYVPNAFTPNNDLYNDYFLPIVDGVIDYEFSIYERLGKRIFRTNDYSNNYLACISDNSCNAAWNGKVDTSDEFAAKGTYIYRIILTDTNGKIRTYEGTVTLIR